jgi:hypothetical protein
MAGRANRFRFLGASALLLASCAGAVGSSGIEDKARRDVPVAICRTPLNQADTTEAGAPRPETYWKTLFPKFHGFGAPVDLSSPDCVGDRLLLTPGAGSAPPLVVSTDDLTTSPADEGLQAVWLHAAAASDFVAYGPLALARARPSELDVYAIGLYRGSARHTRIELAKMGARSVVVARDESCADVKPGSECESTLFFYLVGGGHLALGGKTAMQHVQFGMMKDVGRVQSRLTTEPPVYEGESVRIKEKLSVRDSGEDEVRRSEGERIFTLRGDELVPNKDSIWSQAPHP